MSIFATPKENLGDLDDGTRVLFLHGLEGAPNGGKALHLKEHWNARAPLLRSKDLREMQMKHPSKSWQEMPAREFKQALDNVYDDAVSALQYLEPDVIVGSSMGGALLARLVLERKWTGPCVFLAPAIESLLGVVELPLIKSSVWILAEVDNVVPNASNIKHCKKVEGNLMLSANDTHRLQKALSTGLIDCAIVTALELENAC